MRGIVLTLVVLLTAPSVASAETAARPRHGVVHGDRHAFVQRAAQASGRACVAPLRQEDQPIPGRVRTARMVGETVACECDTGSAAAIVAEIEQGCREAIVTQLRPAPAGDPADQAIGHGGIEPFASRQLTERSARGLGLNDPVQRACPAAQRFHRRQAFPAQCAGKLVAVLEAQPGRELGQGGWPTIHARERAQNRAPVRRKVGQRPVQQVCQLQRRHRELTRLDDEVLIPHQFQFAPLSCYFSVLRCNSRSSDRSSSRMPASISPTKPKPNRTTPEITSTMIRSRRGRNPMWGGPYRR